jgi:hypothetical protein
MIVWRGKGILVALIAFGCLVLAELVDAINFSRPELLPGVEMTSHSSKRN